MTGIRTASHPALARLRRVSGYLRWLAPPLLLVLSYWALRHVAWRQLGAVLVAARPAWLGAAILLQVVVLALWAELWRCFVPARESVRYRTLLGTVTLSGAILALLPSVTGQASAGALLVRRCRMRVTSAATVLVGDQVVEAATKSVILVLALAFAPLPPRIRPATQIGAAVFAGVAILAVFTGRLWRRAPAVLREWRVLLRAAVVGLAVKATEAIILVSVQRSLGVRLNAGAVLLLLVLIGVGIIVGNVLPVPGPIGTPQAIVVAGYTQLGLGLELSLALVALQSAVVLLPRGLGALGVLIADALSPQPPRAAPEAKSAESG